LKLKWIVPFLLLLSSAAFFSSQMIASNGCSAESHTGPIGGLPAESYSNLVLEWTCEDGMGLRPLENNEATGYRVTIQADMPAEGLSFATIAVNPYTYQYGYVSPPPTGFDPLTDTFMLYDSRLEWFTFSPIPTGTVVSLVAKCDSFFDPSFMAWSSDIPTSSYTYANNILADDMMTSNEYEIAHFEWTSQGDTLYVAGFCNEGMEEEVKLDIYLNSVYSAAAVWGGRVQRSLYYFGENRTFDLLYHGYVGATEATRDLVATEFVPDITVNQFWSPHVTIESFDRVSSTEFNISWSSTDLSPNDENWYEVAVSYYDSYIYVPIAENLTEAHYLWDSSSYTPGTYSLRVRAYSIDTSYRIAPYISIPDDYWPGDYGEAYTDRFHAGAPVGYVLLSEPDDVSIVQGTESQSISWTIGYSDMEDRTERVDYDVFDNGRLLINSFVTSNQDNRIVLDLHDLDAGYHNLTLVIYNPDGTKTLDSVNVYIQGELEQTGLFVYNLALLGFEGICGGVIILFSCLSAKEYQKRKKMGAV
jgi:hypothetical protein